MNYHRTNKTDMDALTHHTLKCIPVGISRVKGKGHASLYIFDNNFENHPTPWPQGHDFFLKNVRNYIFVKQ